MRIKHKLNTPQTRNRYFLAFTIIVVICYSDRMCMLAAGFKSLDPLLWSLQNKMFKSAEAFNEIPIEHIIEVRIGEFLNLLCPKFNPSNDNLEYETAASLTNGGVNAPPYYPYSISNQKNQIEYHSIYMVSKQEYDECRIYDIEQKKAILKCDKPYENLKYTLYISKYSPVPDAIEFIPGSNYYFISTSNGSFEGLNNAIDGTCKTNNMRIVIKVLDSKAKPSNSNSHNSNNNGKSKPNTNVFNLPLNTQNKFIKNPNHHHHQSSKMTQTPSSSSSSSSILSSLSTTSTHRPSVATSSSTSNYDLLINTHQSLSMLNRPSNLITKLISSSNKILTFTTTRTTTRQNKEREGEGVGEEEEEDNRSNFININFNYQNENSLNQPKSQKQQTQTKQASTKSKTVNDIFILEPDSIDYSDLLNQLISSTSTSNNEFNRNNSDNFINAYSESSSSSGSSSSSNGDLLANQLNSSNAIKIQHFYLSCFVSILFKFISSSLILNYFS